MTYLKKSMTFLKTGVVAWVWTEREGELPVTLWNGNQYAEFVERQAKSRRRYLHASRMIGLLAGTLAGGLVFASLALATFK
jgi:hypothetical protein